MSDLPDGPDLFDFPNTGRPRGCNLCKQKDAEIAALKAASPSGSSSLVGLVDSEEFYNLMQTYRHTPLLPPGDVVDAFEAVKAFIVEAALATQTGRAGWQHISTAPKDGTTLLLKGDDWTRTAYWAVRIGTWVVDCVVPLSPPKFWMPLPPVSETKA